MVKTYDDQPLFQQAVETMLSQDNGYVRERVVWTLNVRLSILDLEHRCYCPRITPHDLAWAGYHAGARIWLCAPTKRIEFLDKQKQRRVAHREGLIKELANCWYIDWTLPKPIARKLVDKLILRGWKTQTLRVETD